MHDNCFFVDPKRILAWAMQDVSLASAKLKKLWLVNLITTFYLPACSFLLTSLGTHVIDFKDL